MYNVQNKTAMITGAATGIGYKCAKILLRNGAKKVAIVDLSTSEGQNAAATLENKFGKDRAVFIACDVSKNDDLKKTFEKIVDLFEGLDILINNAGIVNDVLWKETIEINFNAVVYGSMLAFDYMGKHKGGKGGVIVNMSSVAGLDPKSLFPIYSATKHAVLSFSQSLAKTYNKSGVRVVVMCPGGTITKVVGINVKAKMSDSIKSTIGNSFYTSITKGVFTMQTPEHVALAMLELIQKGESGAVWVSENRQPPYAVDFPHYSKRSRPI
ncbi:15-hydroxyprostaglandin dehydrogenase [NAD(+)]-like [Solenopsis invicta]|uniref:15-hydroxyprostaglandin dehydrogenase [NAD(+)]-like n=1 Tax=Solenopsis invicta TaxID=13686 RepID=UPI0001FE8261|nr:15-hydroxyprostaglandin dehydrogenase [NAD(+)]-like [Solenopsis invicta]